MIVIVIVRVCPYRYVVLRVDRVTKSCGYSLPLYDFKGYRTILKEFSEGKGKEGMVKYRGYKNSFTIGMSISCCILLPVYYLELCVFPLLQICCRALARLKRERRRLELKISKGIICRHTRTIFGSNCRSNVA